MKNPSPQIFLAFLLLLGVAGCDGPEGWLERGAVGAQAPGFTLPALDGSRFESDSLAGKVTVLNFWATWCLPCRREIPELKALAADPRLEVVGIALDPDGPGTVEPFVRDHAIPYRVLLGNEEVFRRFRGYAIPYTLVLDAGQRVINVYRGPITRQQVEADLRGLEEEAGLEASA